MEYVLWTWYSYMQKTIMQNSWRSDFVSNVCEGLLQQSLLSKWRLFEAAAAASEAKLAYFVMWNNSSGHMW